MACLAASAAVAAEPSGLGRRATQAEIDGWNIDILPDGSGLPAGKGSVADGRTLFEARCAGCHALAPGGASLVPALAGGRGTLATPHPQRTIGSYWPYATTVFDYVRRAMPLDAPGTLSSDQLYAVVAFLLASNGIVPDGTVLDANALAAVRMPNRDGFRPVWPSHD